MKTEQDIVQIINNWVGCFKVRKGESGLLYGIMGYGSTKNSAFVVGPCDTESELIQTGYRYLYRVVEGMVNG